MATISRKKSKRSSRGGYLPVLVAVCLFFLVLLAAVFLITGDEPVNGESASATKSVENPNLENQLSKNALSHFHFETTGLRQGLRSAVVHKRQQLRKALETLTEGHIPARLKALREKGEVIGERLVDIRSGKETVPEILQGEGDSLQAAAGGEELMDKPPIELKEIIEYLDSWIHQLHDVLLEHKTATFEGIWQAYHDLTVKTLYPWDREYLKRMPPRRNDGSIFLSIATYRDENCFNTIYNAYGKAKNPDKLYVGLVQQNCHENCKSGVLSNLSMVEVPPDDDCYKLFCESDLGKHCDQVRVLNINEPESLGPYAARYFTSKLWYGEPWFMQIDAHMTFATNWDSISLDMLNKCPSPKPVLSHYPPSHTVNLDKRTEMPTSRLCGPVFATSDLESQIIRLEGAGVFDQNKPPLPCFAPFTAAGYFVAHSDFLREVPFDPFLPWIFMGEEIIMSSRLWTAGYDIFGPNQAVVGHMYVRRHKPKFWESVHRMFTMGVHNPLQAMVLDRVKYQLGYPEAAKDILRHKSVLTAVDHYGMGTARPLEQYLRLVGLNMTTKEVTYTGWCEEGTPPPGFEEYNHLYPGRDNMRNKGGH